MRLTVIIDIDDVTGDWECVVQELPGFYCKGNHNGDVEKVADEATESISDFLDRMSTQ